MLEEVHFTGKFHVFFTKCTIFMLCHPTIYLGTTELVLYREVKCTAFFIQSVFKGRYRFYYILKSVLSV